MVYNCWSWLKMCFHKLEFHSHFTSYKATGSSANHPSGDLLFAFVSDQLEVI